MPPANFKSVSLKTDCWPLIAQIRATNHAAQPALGWDEFSDSDIIRMALRSYAADCADQAALLDKRAKRKG